jgi:hypothetical protein
MMKEAPMPIGHGKYDVLCTYVREAAKAKSAIVIVFGGEKGDGFSAQLTADLIVKAPKILRDCAQQIEDSFKTGQA